MWANEFQVHRSNVIIMLIKTGMDYIIIVLSFIIITITIITKS